MSLEFFLEVNNIRIIVIIYHNNSPVPSQSLGIGIAELYHKLERTYCFIIYLCFCVFEQVRI